MCAKDFSINIKNDVAKPGAATNLNVNTPANSGISVNQSAPPPVQEEKELPTNQVYGNIPDRPVLDAVERIKFDFNDGIRVATPPNGREYRVAFSDMDTGVYLYNAIIPPGGMVNQYQEIFYPLPSGDISQGRQRADLYSWV